ncbi:MAG: aldo/keto reductase [Candidatus Hydrogenedentes bacterium]|nr:aldo/keto reductase [Candidatus Hydrogenedentota bacterium]
MAMKRREFLGATLAGAAGMMIAPVWTARAAEVNPTAIVPLGKALKACRISCGTGMAGGNRESNQTRQGKEKFEALLNHAYDLGIRHFDLADLYGTHPYVAGAMKDKPREDLQYVTKIWTQPGGIPGEDRPLADVMVDRFLQELQTDYVDVVQIHCMTDPAWTTLERKNMDLLAEAKAKGKIKAHGVSCHSMDALKLAASEPWVDVIHARINPFGHRTDGTIEEIVAALQVAKANGKGVIGMKLIGEGSFDAEKRKETLAAVMTSGVVDCMTIGFEAPEQIDDFVSNVRQQLEKMA